MGSLELDRVDAGSLTRLDDAGVTLPANAVLGLRRVGSALRVFVNDVEQAGVVGSDSTHATTSKIGLGVIGDNTLLTQFVDVGGGNQVPDSPATISVLSGSDDGYAYDTNAVYANLTGATAGVETSATTFRFAWKDIGFWVGTGVIFFDTSALPDDAVVVSAQLQLYVTNKVDTDNRSLVLDWYADSPPVIAADFLKDGSGTAHAGLDITGIPTGALLTVEPPQPRGQHQQDGLHRHPGNNVGRAADGQQRAQRRVDRARHLPGAEADPDLRCSAAPAGRGHRRRRLDDDPALVEGRRGGGRGRRDYGDERLANGGRLRVRRRDGLPDGELERLALHTAPGDEAGRQRPPARLVEPAHQRRPEPHHHPRLDPAASRDRQAPPPAERSGSTAASWTAPRRPHQSER